MRIYITGANGGLGQALMHSLGAQGHDMIGSDIDTVDVADYAAIFQHISQAVPALVIHCAALTNVDRCAQFPDEALRINAIGTQNVALACQRVGAALCYVSTNEVFDGEQGDTPYLEYDPPRPANPYGYSKWVGEQMVRELIAQHYIVRTSWLFAHNGRNFLQRIVSLAREGKPLSVVTDEVANPTYVHDLADAIARLVATGFYGVYHLVNEGRTSRYTFARHILDRCGLTDYPITPIVRAQYPRPSRPPAYAALRNYMAAQRGIVLRPWPEALAAFIEREATLTASAQGEM